LSVSGNADCADAEAMQATSSASGTRQGKPKLIAAQATGAILSIGTFGSVGPWARATLRGKGGSSLLNGSILGSPGPAPACLPRRIALSPAVWSGQPGGQLTGSAPLKSSNLQEFVERVIQTLKHEVLNGFCVVNKQHLDYTLRAGTDWCNHRRGHSGREHLPPVRDVGNPPLIDLAKHHLVCHTELGGHLKSYWAA